MLVENVKLSTILLRWCSSVEVRHHGRPFHTLLKTYCKLTYYTCALTLSHPQTSTHIYTHAHTCTHIQTHTHLGDVH